MPYGYKFITLGGESLQLTRVLDGPYFFFDRVEVAVANTKVKVRYSSSRARFKTHYRFHLGPAINQTVIFAPYCQDTYL